jgi:SAM-dependent methyltransferase
MDTQRPVGPADDLRPRLHAMWASVAQSWGEHADYVDTRGAVISDTMLELSAPQPGERVLELACGPGGLGIAAAARVGPTGEVVVSDIAAEMVAIAVARAEARGLTNVRACRLDLEDIEQPDATYDVVLCREGLMFATDAARATREIGRVLRPDGRVAIAVWGPRARNPWLGVVFEAMSAQLGMPVPPPGIPGPFALSDAAHLRDLLRDAELHDVEVSDLPVPLRAESVEEWWARTCALAGPLSTIVASLPHDAAEALAGRAREAAAAYATHDGVEFPGLTLVATGGRR